MTEHLTEPEIGIYRSRVGEAAARQRAAAHLATCQQCVSRVYDAEHSALAVNALSEAFLSSIADEPFHLSLAELKEYVSGEAPEANRIICESHIDICERCSDELLALTAAQVAKPKSKRKLAWLRSGWLANTPARVAAAIVLIGLVAFGLLLMWRRSSTPAPIQLAGNEPRQTPDVSAPVTSPTVPESSPSLVVRLKDNGKEIGLDQQGRLVGLEEFDESTQKTVKSALAGEPVTKPSVLDGLKSPPIQLMGETDEKTLQLASPLGQVITETRPTLRWEPLAGATNYVAGIFDSQFNLVASSAPLLQPSWTVSAPLKRGQTYVWEVTAMKDGQEVRAPVAPALRAQFRILEADKLSVLQNLQRRKPTSHLALGLMYARFGLLAEAEGEFQQLLRENPDSAAAKKLLRTVHSWR